MVVVENTCVISQVDVKWTHHNETLHLVMEINQALELKDWWIL
jgi:hypothetical protein